MLASSNSYLRPRSHSSSRLIYPIMYSTHPFGGHVVTSIDMLKIEHFSSTWPFFSLSSSCTNDDLSQRPQDHPCHFSFSHLPHPIHCCKLPISPSNISTPLSTFQLPSPSSKVKISLFYLYQPNIPLLTCINEEVIGGDGSGGGILVMFKCKSNHEVDLCLKLSNWFPLSIREKQMLQCDPQGPLILSSCLSLPGWLHSCYTGGASLPFPSQSFSRLLLLHSALLTLSCSWLLWQPGEASRPRLGMFVSV